MIKDTLNNANLYYQLSSSLKKGFEWLESTDINTLEDGKYLIEGEKVYASIQTYETKNDAKYESHKKYIDIQYIVSGEEKIGVTNLKNCTSCIAYEKSKDLEFYDINCDEEYLSLTKGEFLVLFPHDAHKPSISKTNKTIVRKVVVKVAIEG